MDESGLRAVDIRSRTSAVIRERQDALSADVVEQMAGLGTDLKPELLPHCAEVVIRLFAASVDAGTIDTESDAMRDLERLCPPLTTRQLPDSIHQAERVILDEIALDERLGATSEPWAVVAHTIRRATLEILGAHAEQIAGRDVPVRLRDPLTTLITSPVFGLALAQEIERAHRHRHALVLLLFDLDDLSRINREQGWGVGDRLLERMGIHARRFFRTHDWVARYGDDAIAALLTGTTLDQAAILAARFREMVQSRFVLKNEKTDVITRVTVSAAVVGTDLVQSELDPAFVLAEAEAAVVRAKLNGRNRVERVALLPTSLTIFGAGTMLGVTPRAVSRLIQNGALKASRRGRHLHIDRDAIEAYRKNR